MPGHLPATEAGNLELDGDLSPPAVTQQYESEGLRSGSWGGGGNAHLTSPSQATSPLLRYLLSGSTAILALDCYRLCSLMRKSQGVGRRGTSSSHKAGILIWVSTLNEAESGP